MANRYEIERCPNCSLNKSSSSHSCGSYRIYNNGFKLKLKCKSCGWIIRFKITRGGNNNED